VSKKTTGTNKNICRQATLDDIRSLNHDNLLISPPFFNDDLQKQAQDNLTKCLAVSSPSTDCRSLLFNIRKSQDKHEPATTGPFRKNSCFKSEEIQNTIQNQPNTKKQPAHVKNRKGGVQNAQHVEKTKKRH
jgi:hypothetical protein